MVSKVTFFNELYQPSKALMSRSTVSGALVSRPPTVFGRVLNSPAGKDEANEVPCFKIR